MNSLVNTISLLWIEKEIILPIEENQPQIIIDFQTKVIKQADEKANKGSYKAYQPAFYRNPDLSSREDFFTSPENRIRFENILLKKGVEILNDSNVRISNIRPLGYSLPSYKDFGFGTLCFTWRNIPNNTPLVFWYLSSKFIPLFEKKQTN